MTESFILNFPERLKFTDDEFYEFCQQNQELRFERTNQGRIVVKPLISGKSEINHSILDFEIQKWNYVNRKGILLDSKTQFKLPDTSIKFCDLAWIGQRRWDNLTATDKAKFPPICPDFVLNLLAPEDNIYQARQDMEIWIDNGCQLAWLIDPAIPRAFIFRPKNDREMIAGFRTKLPGGDVLQDFEFDLSLLT